VKDSVRRVGYRYAVVQGAAGAQVVLQAIASAKVDLLAFLAFPLDGGRSQLDLFPRDAGALERVASGAGITLSAAKEAIYVDGADRAGALAEHLARITGAGIPITASTAVASAGGKYGFLIFVKQDRLADAVKALGA
jgi:hypothetical protein